MKIASVVLFWVLVTGYGFAQDKKVVQNDFEKVTIVKSIPKLDIRIPIIKLLTRNFNSDLLHSIPKNFAHTVCVAVAFNSEGRIDTIYYSRSISKDVAAILNVSEQASNMISPDNYVFPEYKNKVVQFPIIFKRATDPVLDYNSNFINELKGFWPILNTRDEKKKLILLDTYVNQFMKSH